MNLGEKIDAGARAKGLSLTKLAKLAKMPSRIYLYRMRAGDRTGLRWLPGIAKVLGCTVEWLTVGTGPSPTWAGTASSDYVPAIAALDSAAAVVKAVSHARKADAKAALEAISKARAMVERL